MLIGDCSVGVVEKSATELQVVATASGRSGSGGGAKQMRADVDARGCRGGDLDHLLDPVVAHGFPVVRGEPKH